MRLDTSTFQRISDIAGDSVDDTTLLREMAANARQYLRSFRWCPKIDAIYLAVGVGGIVAIFYCELREKIGNSDDDALWVVVGDIPSAYLVVEPDDSATEALGRYCDMMEAWAFAVEASTPLAEVFPIEAKPTYDNARSLRERVAFIRSEILDLGTGYLSDERQARRK
jgi:hypothetical protein